MVLSSDTTSADCDVYMIDDYESDDVIINHHQETYCPMFRLNCGKSFLDICKELDLDKSKSAHISLL